MRPRFQADADLNQEIVDGLKRREPSIDFQTADELGLRGLADPKVLILAASGDRILVTHVRRTMPRHFGKFLLRHSSPGVILISQNLAIGKAIDELFIIWLASEHDEWQNRIIDLPL